MSAEPIRVIVFIVAHPREVFDVLLSDKAFVHYLDGVVASPECEHADIITRVPRGTMSDEEAWQAWASVVRARTMSAT